MSTFVAPNKFKTSIGGNRYVYLCNLSAWRLFSTDVKTLAARLVLLRLFAFMTARKKDYDRSLVALANECHLSRTRLNVALDELESAGMITRNTKTSVENARDEYIPTTFKRKTVVKLTSAAIARSKFVDKNNIKHSVAVQNWLFEVDYSKVMKKRLEPTMFMVMLLVTSSHNIHKTTLSDWMGTLPSGKLVRPDKVVKYVEELRASFKLIERVIDSSMNLGRCKYHYQMDRCAISSLFDNQEVVKQIDQHIKEREAHKRRQPQEQELLTRIYGPEDEDEFEDFSPDMLDQ